MRQVTRAVAVFESKNRMQAAIRPRRKLKAADLLRRTILCAFVVLASASHVFSHDGKPHNWEDLALAWSFDPLVITILIASAVLYISGLRRLWNSGARGSGITVGESLAFALGWLSMFIALVSPLHPWGEVLFSAHMTQHEILMLISAPLFVIGRPFIAAMWAIPRRAAQRVAPLIKHRHLKRMWRFVTAPFVAWAIHAAALWIWHIPFLFQATLQSNLVHTLQHASFFISALLFWWAIIYGRSGVRAYGAGVLYLFTTSIQSGLLGVFLTLSTRVWYPAYSSTTASWGLTPLEDQQLGGLIMWIPAGVVYIVAALIMFSAWLRESDATVIRPEHTELEQAVSDSGV